mgnify:CR=1 FL=1
MNKTELAVRTLCAGLGALETLTGKIPFMCAVTGHKWGVRTEADRIADRFYCARCGHVEYANTAELCALANRDAQAQLEAYMLNTDDACQHSHNVLMYAGIEG